MSALELLANYSSDSDVSDSEKPVKHIKLIEDSSEKLSQSRQQSRSNKLPLPSLFTKQKSQKEDFVDDPNKHQGKIRNFPHERGNWATYIYIPYPVNDEFENFVEKLRVSCSSGENSIYLSDDYHVSVSKTLILRFHWINTFISSLRESCKQIPKFFIEFDSVEVYTNDNNSRTFIGLKITRGFQHLQRIVKEVDETLKEFSLPLFYDDPSFHISVLWCHGNKKQQLNQILPELNNILKDTFSSVDEDHLHHLCVEHLVCKTGNKVFNISLG